MKTVTYFIKNLSGTKFPKQGTSPYQQLSVNQIDNHTNK